MKSEANDAIAGALEVGAETIPVNDSHWVMRNLLAEELNPVAELLGGGPNGFRWLKASKPASMQQCSSVSCPSWDAECQHRAYLHRKYEALTNGEAVGELALNAATAGVTGVRIIEEFFVPGEQWNGWLPSLPPIL